MSFGSDERNDYEARDMVMNFLARKGFVVAANEFRLKSDTHPYIDLETLAAYIQVNRAIMSGNMADAIDKLTVLIPPLVLERNTQLVFHLQQQLAIEVIRNGCKAEALKVIRSKLRPFLDHHQTDFTNEILKTVTLLVFRNVHEYPNAKELLNVERRREIARDVNQVILENAARNQDLDLELEMLLKCFEGLSINDDDALRMLLKCFEGISIKD